MAISEKTKQFLLYATILIIASSGIIYYTNYSINIVKQDYTSQILQLSSNLREVEKGLRDNINDLGGIIDEINYSLSAETSSLKANLIQFKQQNQKELNALSTLIEQIEKQSNIKLQALKTELKDIQIKSADFSAIVDDVLKSVVSVDAGASLGSGVVIKENGYILTNFHVVSGATSLRVRTTSNDVHNAQLIGYNSNADIAILKISTDLPILPFGNSAEVKVGSKVIALGNPAGLDFTVTEGIVSAIRQNSNGLKYIQTDVPMNPGNSGGPLVDQKAEIVGINNFKVKGFESLGFAVSSNDASTVANSIITAYENSEK